ncbi:MAG TPA: G5 domain-containing protein, partial [Anaerolineae bacterium]|nr:G5 domain-containing protein [Anaerolineae bacterium]
MIRVRGAAKEREYRAAGVRGSVVLSLGARLLLLALVPVVAACGEPEPVRVSLTVDGARQVLDVTSDTPITVRDLLPRVDVTLGSMDRVQPDLYVELTDGLEIVVTRVAETFESERQVIPFERETVRSEAVPEGERRLLQSGRNGEAEIVYRVLLEDGLEVSREQVRRDVLLQPVNETVLVGVQGELAAVSITGTVVYLSGGNAW